MPALAASASRGKASASLPCSLSRIARRRAAAGEPTADQPIRRHMRLVSLIDVASPPWPRDAPSRLAHRLLADRQHQAEEILSTVRLPTLMSAVTGMPGMT